MAPRSSKMRRQIRAARDAISHGHDGSGSDGNSAKPEAAFAPIDGPNGGGAKRSRPRMKKLRMILVLLGLMVLAGISWIFGIMMAVAQDLPRLETRQQYVEAKNSTVTDRFGTPLTTLTGNEARILVESADISPTMKQAVVAIEDERFYDHRGVDPIGIARALVKDVISRSAVQGASTITQQFVKNALEAQQSRTIFQKLRESALAYHLEREWSKDKILTQYLNSIYFGEGAYGIEAAARTYFGNAPEHEGCGGKGDRCAAQLLPHEAALLAGIISSPEANSPRANPEAAEERRNVVLGKMLEQGAITQEQFDEESAQPLPTESQIEPPREESASPFFTSWLRQQVVDHYGAGRAFGGGLQIQSTLDLELQQATEAAIADNIGGIAPTSSVVVMDNATGGVLAMVGGTDYDKSPFNLATNGHRQPGSAIKPFTLVTALSQGRSTSEVFTSEAKEFPFRVKLENKAGKVKTFDEFFPVSNYGDGYYGSISLFDATTNSDNSVYSELGLQVGLENVAATAKALGVQTDLKTDAKYSINDGPFQPYNPALTLGGLEIGVTPLEMTHAYLTLARDGQRISGTLASSKGGPVGISQVKNSGGDLIDTNDGESGQNEVVAERAVSADVATTAKSVLETVVSNGTGVRAQYGGYAWGKTGTTENNGDAWFCGATDEVTACVWVGHAEGNTPMETEFSGAPVDGGTYPALIWADVITAYEGLKDSRKAGKKSDSEDSEDSTTAPLAPAPVEPSAPAPVEEADPAPEEREPAPEPQRPAPSPAAPTTPPPGAEGGAGAVAPER